MSESTIEMLPVAAPLGAEIRCGDVRTLNERARQRLREVRGVDDLDDDHGRRACDGVEYISLDRQAAAGAIEYCPVALGSDRHCGKPNVFAKRKGGSRSFKVSELRPFRNRRREDLCRVR